MLQAIWISFNVISLLFTGQLEKHYKVIRIGLPEEPKSNFFCLTRLYIHTIIAAYFAELLFSIRVLILSIAGKSF